MGFRTVIINENDFTAAQVRAINSLTAKRQLSAIAGLALREYFLKMNPELKREIAIHIQSEQDIEEVIQMERQKNPDLTNAAIEVIKGALIEEFKKGHFYIDQQGNIFR